MALSGDRAKLYDENAKRKSGISAEALTAPWLSVREASGSSWLCARLDRSDKMLELVAQGDTGGLAALRCHLADDAVIWAVFAFLPGYPYGEGSRKMAFFTCVGPNVGAMKKGKVALQKSGVVNALDGISADVGIFSGAAQVTDAVILNELKRNMPAASLM